MRWCRYAGPDGPRYGIVVGDQVLPVVGDPFDEHRAEGAPVPLAGLRLLPPVIPPTFYAVGMNYRAHVEHGRARGLPTAEIPTRPEVGYRAQSALIGAGDAIVKPADLTGPFETEGELVAVIGRDLRRCSRDEAAAGILGWTIGNDVSAREWQRADRTLWRAKNSDTFKPMGPWIETAVAPLSARTTVHVDGELRSEFGTGDMIFDPFDYIREITRYITLRPGDVLWMGADATVAMEPGSTVSVSISGIEPVKLSV
jgi:2-keto-4-pentenoate hydratase/2-oxohepta-3-ene-1,7-dioic acid hydratase in catechol pathway